MREKFLIDSYISHTPCKPFLAQLACNIWAIFLPPSITPFKLNKIDVTCNKTAFISCYTKVLKILREKTLGHVTFKTFFHGNIEGRNQKLLLPIPGKSLYVHFTVIIFTPSKDGLLKSNHHATQLPLKLVNDI